MDAATQVPSRSREDIRGWLVETLARELKAPADRVATDEQFTNLGLGSRQAILITGDLETYLGCEELEPSLLWDFPTIDALAAHLAAHLADG